jgi:hypothetical protein
VPEAKTQKPHLSYNVTDGAPVNSKSNAGPAGWREAGYGYRRVAWCLRLKGGLVVNRKRVLPVMRERGLLMCPRRLPARRKKEGGRVETTRPNEIWQSDMTRAWAGSSMGWAYL